MNSYHITKKMGSAYFFWWPLCGFGEYCGESSIARDHYNQTIENDKQGNYHLIEIQLMNEPPISNIMEATDR